MEEGKRKLGIKVLRCKEINKKMWRIDSRNKEKENRNWRKVKEEKQW